MKEQDDLAKRRSQLSAERQLLLKQRLRGQSTAVAHSPQSADVDLLAYLPPFTPAPEHQYEPFPLTDLQKLCWIGQTDFQALNEIYGQIYLEMDGGGLDLDRVQMVINYMVARHPMLRAIVLPDGRQQILDFIPFYQFQVYDLRGVAPEEATARMEALREQMLEQGPITDRWPLFDFCAHRLDDDRLRLHFRMSLVLYDGWSVTRVMQELLQLYHMPDVPLEPIALTFRDYVLAANALQDSPAYRRAYAYWEQRFATLPSALQLPLVVDPSTVRRPRFVRRHFQIDHPLWQQLQDRATRAGLTVNVLLCAAYAEVLTIWSQLPHYTLNLLLANRLPVHPHVELVVGNCTNTLLLEVDHRVDGSFLERARRLQAQLWTDLDHSIVSGVTVIREQARAQGRHVPVSMPVVFDSSISISRSRENFSQSLTRESYCRLQMPQVYLEHQVTEDPVTGVLNLNWEAVEELFPTGLLDTMFDAYRRLLLSLTQDDAAWHTPVKEFLQV